MPTLTSIDASDCAQATARHEGGCTAGSGCAMRAHLLRSLPGLAALSLCAALALAGPLPGHAAPAAPDAEASSHDEPQSEAAPGIAQTRLEGLPSYIRTRWGVDRKRAEEVVDAVADAAAETSVDPLLLLAVIAKESKFRHFGNPKHLAPGQGGKAVDPLAPHGPMQVAGRWHRDKMPRDADGRIRPTSPRENIVLGATLLREYLEHQGGNLSRALQQYNGCRRKNCDRYPAQVLGLRNELERAAARKPRH